MPPIEGKRARTCLACANALRVVCPQLIDCARGRLDQTLHGLRVTSITRVMETLVAWPISKTSPFWAVMSHLSRLAHDSIAARTNPMQLTLLHCWVALIAASKDDQHLW